MNGSKQSQINGKLKEMIVSFGKMKRSHRRWGNTRPKVGDFIKRKREKIKTIWNGLAREIRDQGDLYEV